MITYAVTTDGGRTVTFEHTHDGNTITHAILARWEFNDDENLDSWSNSEDIATENAAFLKGRFDRPGIDRLISVRVVPVRIVAAYS